MIYFNILSGLMPLRILRIFFLNLNKNNTVSYKSNIGFGLYPVKSIEVRKGGKIENFTFIKVDKLILGENSTIRRFNVFKGPFSVILKEKSGLGKGNKFIRSKYPIVYNSSVLKLHQNSFINSNHFIDLTKSVTFGKNSVLAGRNSQIWTHGYYHANKGSDRIRIDGEVVIGNNVYIGSKCVFNPGVKVSNAIHIGAGSVISKDLEESGMYVSQGLRYIKNDIDTIKEKLHKVEDSNLVEQVYYK